jgi:hypothetical protein
MYHVVDMNVKATKNFSALCTEFKIGKNVADLTVIGLPFRQEVGTQNQQHWFIPLKCKCGKEIKASVGHLRNGLTKSCGCARIERFANLNKTHGLTSDPLLHRLYQVHNGILQRCRNLKNKHYGQKGISMCQEWCQNKIAFILWCLNNGYAPGLVLDRKKSKEGYSPTNCHFIDERKNCNNRSSSKTYVYGGEEKTLPDHCRNLGLNDHTVWQRIKTYGWPVEKALSTPTEPPDHNCFVYLGYRRADKVLTVGRSASWYSRLKKLKTSNFEILSRYSFGDDCQIIGFVEFLFQDWLDKHGVKRGIGPKSKNSEFSPETFLAADAAKSNFKFRKLCLSLSNTVPGLKTKLFEKIDKLNKLADVQEKKFKPDPLPDDPIYKAHPITEYAPAQITNWMNDNHVYFEEVNGVIILPHIYLAIKSGDYSVSIEDRNNPQATKAMYNLYKELESKNIHLFTIFEDDWTKNKNVAIHWLSHKLNLGQRICQARQCTPDRIAASEAKTFYEQFHLQGFCHGQHYGLRHGTVLVACLTLSTNAPERKRSLESGTFNLTRMAFAGQIPGAASKLFSYATKASEASKIITYSANSYATGEVYKKLGFTFGAEIPPDYRVWHEKFGVRHKAFWQRRCIPDRISSLGLQINFDPKLDTRSEFDMEWLLGCRHVWDCGKKRWHWTHTDSVTPLPNPVLSPCA